MQIEVNIQKGIPPDPTTHHVHFRLMRHSLLPLASSTGEGGSNADTVLASGLLVQGDVVVQLSGLLINLGLVGITTLSSLDLQGQHLELKLQDLVLDLAVLERRGVARGSSDLVVESTSVSLG